MYYFEAESALQHHSVIPLKYHPAASNVLYVRQVKVGVNLFDTFEEERMVTPTIPQCKNRDRAQQHSANNDQHHTPCIFHPITFTSNQVYHAAPHQSINHILMVNGVINQDTGSSLEYRQLIQDETTFPVWNKAASNVFGRLTQDVGG
jgi:hypothetical protein